MPSSTLSRDILETECSVFLCFTELTLNSILGSGFIYQNVNANISDISSHVNTSFLYKFSPAYLFSLWITFKVSVLPYSIHIDFFSYSTGYNWLPLCSSLSWQPIINFSLLCSSDSIESFSGVSPSGYHNTARLRGRSTHYNQFSLLTWLEITFSGRSMNWLFYKFY